jgi:hypothetical protein
MIYLFLYFLYVTSSSAIQYNNECDTDAQCIASNGKCSSYTGMGHKGRCVCAQGYTFVPTNFRCERMSGQNTQEIIISSSVRYQEQLSVTPYLIRTPGYLPTHWHCSVSGDYCYSEGKNVTWSIYGHKSLLSYGQSVPLGNISWSCQRGVAVIQSSDLTTISTYTGSMRPLEEHCVDIDCGQGIKVNNSCVCNSGYTGSNCRTPTNFNVAGYHWYFGVFDPGNTLYNAARSCVTDANCGSNEYCWDVLTSSPSPTKRCWCKAGFIPGSIVDNCWATSVTSFYGAVDSLYFYLYYDGYYSVDSKTAWWQNYTTEIATFSWYPITTTDSMYRADFTHMLYKRCIDFEWNGQCYRTAQCPNGNCTCPVNTTRSSASLDCICSNGMSGVGCNITTTQCSNVNCNGNGQCVGNLSLVTCSCNPFQYYDSVCSLPASTCSTTRCNDHGVCVGQEECLCDSGYYGRYCTLTTTQCRQQRCSGRGSCATQTQQCQCDTYFNDYDCSNVTCQNGGQKISSSECSCSANVWSGVACEVYICGLHGSRVNGTCECTGLYIGTYCNQTICDTNGRLGNNVCICNTGYTYVTNEGCLWDCTGQQRISSTKCKCDYAHFGDHCEITSESSLIYARIRSDYDYLLVFVVIGAVMLLIGPFVVVMWRNSDTRFHTKDTVDDILSGFYKESINKILH